MSISMGTNYSLYDITTNSVNTKTSNLENNLSKNLENATDDELMGVCKEFESYLIEQVFKEMKEAMTDNSEEDNDYESCFGDMLYQSYANDIVESGGFGIAQQLYESMKRDVNIQTVEEIPVTSNTDIEVK